MFADRMRTLFPFVSRPVVMRNSNNSPLYALFLASHYAKAVTITNQIFDSRRRTRGADMLKAFEPDFG